MCFSDMFDCFVGPAIRVHPDNCQLYIQCDKGRRTYMLCPRGTLFDPQTHNCDIWYKVLDKCEEDWEELSTVAPSTTDWTTEHPTT